LCWKAEEANATRIAAKGNLLLAGITALLGLKLHQFSTGLAPIEHSPCWQARWLFWISVATSACLLLLALASAIELKWWKQRAEPNASVGLSVDAQLAKAPQRFNKDHISFHLWTRTYRAYLDLQVRNAERKANLDRAQVRFFTACIFVASAVVMYAILSHHHAKNAPPVGHTAASTPTPPPSSTPTAAPDPLRTPPEG